jgi:hypothetical protein
MSMEDVMDEECVHMPDRCGPPQRVGSMPLWGAIALASLALTGCASKGPDPDVDLAELTQLIPGHYDNTAQVQADIAHGVQPPHEALALDIVPIEAMSVGEHLFYVQEMIAGDPRRVLGQKVMMFGVVKKQVVQTDFALADPHRWRNAQSDPEVFKGLTTEDLHSVKGCSLRWKKTDGRLVATNEPKTCHSRVGSGGGMAQIESKAELGPEEYATAELAYDKPGHLAMGRLDDPYYRFHKQSSDSE